MASSFFNDFGSLKEEITIVKVYQKRKSCDEAEALGFPFHVVDDDPLESFANRL